jgi:hypothetical protein
VSSPCIGNHWKKPPVSLIWLTICELMIANGKDEGISEVNWKY